MAYKKKTTGRLPGKFCIIKFSKQKQFELFRFSRRRYAIYDVEKLPQILEKKKTDLCFFCPQERGCKFNKTSTTAFFKHVKDVEIAMHKQLIYFIGERKVQQRPPRKSIGAIANGDLDSIASFISNQNDLRNSNHNDLNDTEPEKDRSHLLKAKNTPESDVSTKIKPKTLKSATKSTTTKSTTTKLTTTKSTTTKSSKLIKPKATVKKSSSKQASDDLKSATKMLNKSSGKQASDNLEAATKMPKKRLGLENGTVGKVLKAKSKTIVKETNRKPAVARHKMNGDLSKHFSSNNSAPLTPVASRPKIDNTVTPNLKPKNDRRDLTSTPIQFISPILNLFNRLIPSR